MSAKNQVRYSTSEWAMLVFSALCLLVNGGVTLGGYPYLRQGVGVIGFGLLSSAVASTVCLVAVIGNIFVPVTIFAVRIGVEERGHGAA